MNITYSEKEFKEFDIPIVHVLQNRGITDPDILNDFVSDTLDKYENDYSLLNNIEKGIETLEKHIKEQNKIYIIVDPDVDGYTSAAIMALYIEKRYPECREIEYIMHDGKEHGIILENIPEDCDLLIVPDAGRAKTA